MTTQQTTVKSGNGATPLPFKLANSGITQSELALLIHGPPGAGKTTLIGTLPGRVFVLNVLPGERGAPIVLANKRDRIDVVNVRDWSEIAPIYDHLKQPREKHGYNWFALDSFTALSELARRRTLRERAQKGINADPAIMTKQDWGNMGGFLNEFLFQFLGLGIPKLFITQERRYESEDLGNQIGPDTRPAVLGFLLQSMNGIGRLYSVPLGGGKYERRLRVGSDPSYLTKWQIDSDRTEWPNIIREPNLEAIVNYCYGPVGKYAAPLGVDEAAEEAATELTALG